MKKWIPEVVPAKGNRIRKIKNVSLEGGIPLARIAREGNFTMWNNEGNWGQIFGGEVCKCKGPKIGTRKAGL